MRSSLKRTFVVTALIMGILLSLQVRSFRSVAGIVERADRRSVLAELRTLQLANEDLREQIREEDEAVTALKTRISQDALDEEVEILKTLSGHYPVQGQGVQIIIPSAVEAFWLNDLVAHVVSFGGEAVALNGIRLAPETAGMRATAGGILLRDAFLKPSFTIDVIGPKSQLRESIIERGGIVDRIEKAYPGLRIDVHEKDIVAIGALK